MRMHRFMQFLTITTTFATVGTLVACSPRVRPESRVEVSANWNSAQLDREYAAERGDLDARHKREIATPEPGESKYDMDHRQANENNSLELRYKQGKESHSDSLPPS